MSENKVSNFVARMRGIGDKWVRRVLKPLPRWHTARGQFNQVRKHSWRRIPRGRWIPPRERQGRSK